MGEGLGLASRVGLEFFGCEISTHALALIEAVEVGDRRSATGRRGMARDGDRFGGRHAASHLLGYRPRQVRSTQTCWRKVQIAPACDVVNASGYELVRPRQASKAAVGATIKRAVAAVRPFFSQLGRPTARKKVRRPAACTAIRPAACRTTRESS